MGIECAVRHKLSLTISSQAEEEIAAVAATAAAR